MTQPSLSESGGSNGTPIPDRCSCRPLQLHVSAADDLHGWIEDKSGNVTRHVGILDHFAVSRSECDAIILHARFKAGWIK